jgi:hypothetical protein
MTRKELEANYRQMPDEQLLELATEMEDLLPEAKEALLAELRRRGKPPSDVEPYATEERRERASDDAENRQSPDQRLKAEVTARDDGASPASAPAREGPAPADWVRIPAFGSDESFDVAASLREHQIPCQIEQSANFGRTPFLVAVPEDRFADSVGALKQLYGLTDGPPEPFAGDCPACGAKVENAESCPSCGLALSLDVWAALAGHPFVKFLVENGLGKPPHDAKPKRE